MLKLFAFINAAGFHRITVMKFSGNTEFMLCM